MFRGSFQLYERPSLARLLSAVVEQVTQSKVGVLAHSGVGRSTPAECLGTESLPGSRQTIRGADTFTQSLFTMRRPDDHVPADQPLRAMLLQIFFSVRSERQLMEQAQYNLPYRWFTVPAMDDAVWVPGAITNNRERLITQDAIIKLFNHIVETADCKDWLSGEHYNVDGTLIRAWSSHRGFLRKNGAGAEGHNGNAHNTDTTSFKGHTFSDNRHRLIANFMVISVDGPAEREPAKVMIHAACEAESDDTMSLTLGADKGWLLRDHEIARGRIRSGAKRQR